jgi:flagellar biosynthesis protein FlhB
MALPPNVLEQIEKDRSKSPGWSGQILTFSGAILLISIIIYVGLAYGYKSYLNSSLQKLQSQIQSFSEQIPLNEQTNIINFYSQLANLKTLLANHVISSPVFAWLEKNTQTNVFYSKLNLNVATNQLSLSGSAKSVDDFNQQMAVFENSSDVKLAKVNSLSFVNNSWQFEAVITFVPGYFYPGSAAQ